MRFVDRVRAVIARRNEPRWTSIKQEPQERQQSESMERHPYSLTGVDRDGNPKSVETLMRDSTVPAVVRGFWDADYRALEITREGTGPVGGITPAEGFSGARRWHQPIGRDQRQPS
jgi:hypothetical protein